MITTDNETWARKATYLMTQAKDDPVEYIHHEIGYNYRLTNLQAALGCAQIEHLSDYIDTKRNIAASYAEAFKEIPAITPLHEAPWAFSTFWLSTLLLDETRCGADSRTLMRSLGELGIQTRPLWQPGHLSPAHAGNTADVCPIAERLHQQALSIPCSVHLGDDQHQVIHALMSLTGHCEERFVSE